MHKSSRYRCYGPAPLTFLFTSRVVGYFDPSLATRRVSFACPSNYPCLAGNYPYSYHPTPPLFFLPLSAYFHCLGQPQRMVTYSSALPLLLTLRCYLNNTFLQLLFDSLSEYRFAWQLSPSTPLSLPPSFYL